MKKRLKSKIGLVVFILCLLTISASHLFAAEYSHIYEFEQPKIITLSNGQQILEIKGTRPDDSNIGAPVLPAKTAKIFIPANEKVVSVEIVYGTLKTIDGSYVIQHATTPYPLSHKGPITVDKPAPDIYEADTSYPSTIYRARGAQFLHGVRIVLVDLMPVLYNPVKGQLKYYDKLEVRIKTEKQKKPDWVMPFRNSPQDRKKILRTIENKDDFLRLHPSSSQGKPAGASLMAAEPSTAETRQYVVITTTELILAFETLTDHRKSAAGGGYTTHIEDIANIELAYDGVDLAEKMRNFIRDMYDNYGTEYVVLGGDCDGPPGSHVIPTRGCYAVVGDYTDSNIPTDLYFGCLDGTWNDDGDAYWGESNDGNQGGDIDWYSEVYIGRIPADIYTEAMNQINKIIDFETGSRPDRTLLVGEKLDSTPTWGGDRIDWVYSFMDSTQKTELYDRDWANNSWPWTQLLTYINSDEHHWINHLGHSNVTYNMRLSNSDVASMFNSNYLFVYTQGCYSGSIDNRNSGGSYGSTDCFGEAITNSYIDRGAFAYIGNSRYGWYNSGSYVIGASNRAHKEFVEAVFVESITKSGKANQESKTDLDFRSGLYRYIAFETNLLGCPATDLIAIVQGCGSDPDCDDGLFCNGSEVCIDNVCQPGTPPDCPDDGLFCNGTESCDEGSDSCIPSGNPCDPMTTICNESTDQCDDVACFDNTNCNDGNDCTTDTCQNAGTAAAYCESAWHECGIEDGCCGPECTHENDPDCTWCGNGVCENGEDCYTCSEDCISRQGGTCDACFKGVCNGECHPTKEGPECADCAPFFCCGDGACEGIEDSYNCEIDCDAPPVCGDSICDQGEDQCNCPDDCNDPPTAETSCSNGIDDDCDGFIDCGDIDDCGDDPACTCLPKDSPCDDDTECCSGNCHPRKGCL